jgi:polygalacturonase
MNRRDFLVMSGISLATSPRVAKAVGEAVYDVRQYGARGDGREKDTEAIQKAVDTCASAGGGTVYLSPGTYLSGTVVLKENVTFRLESGATLLGSTDLADYRLQPGPPSKGDANGKHLLFARDAANVTVCGGGQIDGQGKAFWVPSNRVAPKPEDAWRDVVAYDWKALDRPSPMLEFFHCKNLRIEDVTIANAAGWTLRPIECDGVLIRGINIRNPVFGPNTDGIDVTCCENVCIADCDIRTGDDAICLKSEGPYGRMGLNRNIVITNCLMTCCCNGLKFGTATRGGFENVAFSNSVIYNDDVPLNQRVISGVAIEMVDGGWLTGVVISNIRMQRVRTPIFIRLGDRSRAQGIPGKLRGVLIENVHATGAILTSSITGLPNQIAEDITVSNVRIDTEENGKAEWLARAVPEQERNYPEARMFGRLPAYGFYCRHIRGLRLDHVHLATTAPEQRPAIHCDDVEDLRVDGFEASAPSSSEPLLCLRNVKGALIAGCRAPEKAAMALAIEGPETQGIHLVANDFRQAAKAFELRAGARASEVSSQSEDRMPERSVP